MKRHPFNGTPVLTNTFRPKTDKRPHLGEDYALSNRTAIVAVASGTVSKVEPAIEKKTGIRQWIANTQNDPYKKQLGNILYIRSLRSEDYGNYIKIDHGQGVSTLYAHLDETLVFAGQSVKEGELIGYSDSTGNSTGGHIHFEIRRNDVVVDPIKFDYEFQGEGGVEAELHELVTKVKVMVPALYVRNGPSRLHRLSGSKEVHKGDIIDIIGFIEGEKVDGNNFWYKSFKGNYFWAGGTDFPNPQLLLTVSNKDMTQQEKDQKLVEFEARAARIEARRVELEGALAANLADAEAYKADWEAFAAEPVEEPVVEPVAEPVVEVAEEVQPEAVAEPVVEPVVEEPAVEVVEVPADVAPEAPMDAVDEGQQKEIEETKTLLQNLEAQVLAIKEKLGL